MFPWLASGGLILVILAIAILSERMGRPDPSLGSLRGWRRLVATLLIWEDREVEFAPLRGWGRIIAAVVLVALLVVGGVAIGMVAVP